MKQLSHQLIITIIGLSLNLISAAWGNPNPPNIPPPPDLPALTRCIAARANFPIGRHYYKHFFALAETTTDGFAEFCLSFVQDPRGSEHAPTWLKHSSHKGFPEAQLLLGSGYESGTRVEHDPSLARYWYEQAAYQNFPHALYELATIYYSGQRLDIPQNYSYAYFWNRLAWQFQFAPAVELNTILEKLITPGRQQQIHKQIHEWNRTHAFSQP